MNLFFALKCWVQTFFPYWCFCAALKDLLGNQTVCCWCFLPLYFLLIKFTFPFSRSVQPCCLSLTFTTKTLHYILVSVSYHLLVAKGSLQELLISISSFFTAAKVKPLISSVSVISYERAPQWTFIYNKMSHQEAAVKNIPLDFYLWVQSREPVNKKISCGLWNIDQGFYSHFSLKIHFYLKRLQRQIHSHDSHFLSACTHTHAHARTHSHTLTLTCFATGVMLVSQR